MQLYQLGRLHCPRCKASRMFVGHDDPDPSAARCIDCQYQFGYTHNPITGELVSVLEREVVAEAKAKLLEEMANDAAASGHTHGAEQAARLLELHPDQRRDAMRRDPGIGWTPEQLRSFAEYQRSAAAYDQSQ